MTATTLRRLAWPDGRLPRALIVGSLLAAGLGVAANVSWHAAGSSSGSGSSASADAAASATFAATAAAAVAQAEAVTTSASAGGAATAPAAGPPGSLPGIGQRIARTATLTIRVPADVAATLDEAAQRATPLGGYVIASSAIGRDGAAPDSGEVTIRVPSEHYGLLVQRLASLGHELSRTVASQDLTQEYVDTGSRLRNDHAVETRLLALLDRAGNVGDVLAVQDRLAAVQQRIEEEQGRLDYLAKITSYSTVTLRVSTPRAQAAVHRQRTAHHPYGLRRALSRAAQLFVHTIDAIVIAAGALAPALALAGLAALVARRRLRRGRRHGVTAAPPGVDGA